jgi:TonB family protein
VVKTQGDQYVVTPKGLGANLVTLRKPSCPVGVPAAELEQVLLRITIDEAGVVRQISPVRGSKAFLEAATQAVSEWRFKPFTPEGKPVPVVASVIFFFGPNGTVSSPVFDEIGK